MRVFADLAFEPVGIAVWVAIGLLGGWLAGAAMKGSGYSLGVDMALGLVGAVTGGILYGLVVSGPAGFVGNVVAAVLGTWLLIIVVRFVVPGETRL
jgi:uncharacterized membrane protein YeaQ/YmgE (transglycosylase-associated protein family)